MSTDTTPGVVAADIARVTIGGVLPTGCSVLADEVPAIPSADGVRWSISFPNSKTTRFVTIVLRRDADQVILSSRSLRLAQQRSMP